MVVGSVVVVVVSGVVVVVGSSVVVVVSGGAAIDILSHDEVVGTFIPVVVVVVEVGGSVSKVPVGGSVGSSEGGGGVASVWQTTIGAMHERRSRKTRPKRMANRIQDGRMWRGSRVD